MKYLFLPAIFLFLHAPFSIQAQKACTQVFKFGIAAGAWQGAAPFSGQAVSFGNETYLSSRFTWGVNFSAFSGKRPQLERTAFLAARNHALGIDGVVRYYFGDESFERFYAQSGIGAAACIWRVERFGQPDFPSEFIAISPALGVGYQHRLNNNWLANFFSSAHLPLLRNKSESRFWWQIGVQFGFIVR